MPQYTETYKLRLTEQQAKTLSVLSNKYKFNTSQFIRDAINEKLQREKSGILEINKYLKLYEDCPF